MKKIILLFIITLTTIAYSQKIVENKTDEFTKKQIVRTDWEKIVATSKLYLNLRLNKIDSTNYIQLKFFPKGVSSIETSDDISFMLDNGEIINLKSTKYKLANYGEGSIGLIGSNALGFNINCLLSKNDIEKFKTNLVKKIRINKSEGYSEDELKDKNSEKLKNLFVLMYP
jgi:hypothetical protein